MWYFLWFMLGCFALAGMFTIFVALQRLILMAIRRRRLVKAVGLIRSIEKKIVHMSSHRMSGLLKYSFIPTIIFTNASGDQVEFVSEVGELAVVTSYRVGQPVEVLYDPDGILPPLIDSWFARWGSHLVMLLGGILFLGGAALVYWIQGQSVFWLP